MILKVVIQHQEEFPPRLGNPVQATVDPEFVAVVVPLDEIDPGYLDENTMSERNRLRREVKEPYGSSTSLIWYWSSMAKCEDGRQVSRAAASLCCRHRSLPTRKPSARQACVEGHWRNQSDSRQTYTARRDRDVVRRVVRPANGEGSNQAFRVPAARCEIRGRRCG